MAGDRARTAKGRRPRPARRRVVNAKLAELLALATDATWSASFSDRQDLVGAYARSERLPGASGLSIDLRSPSVWRVRPSTGSLSQEEAAFWQRFSTRDGDPFGGFEVTTADLAAVLPAAQLTTVLDGLRAIAARREASAFEDAGMARDLRAVVQAYDRSWACPVRVDVGHFEDPARRLRVERLPEGDEWRPRGCWVLRDVDKYVRGWVMPGWWATRRAADDEARSVLARKDARSAETPAG
jgi:hypothetical protein